MAPTMAETTMIAEIISGVNKKVSDENFNDSDLDEAPDLTTNRGNKLKRKAEYAHEGQLYGKRTYKQKINHAGYDRFILKRKPKRFDIDGYPLDSDEEDAEADADAAERNPYNGIDVQSLLMPLTASSELWQHPGMSQAFTNEVLPDMAQKAYEMLRREKSTLYLVKELATKFRGDHNFISCGDIYTENDCTLFDVDSIIKSIRAQVIGQEPEKQTPEAAIEVNVVSVEEGQTSGDKEEGALAKGSSIIDEAMPLTTAEGSADSLNTERPTELNILKPNGTVEKSLELIEVKEETPNNALESNSINEIKDQAEDGTPEKSGDNRDSMQEDSPIPRMVTRGAAAAANGNGASTSQTGEEGDKSARSPSPPTSLPPVHQLFIPPVNCIPDRDLGLPPFEAEDTRKLLNVFVQKQEEVVRGCERMYESFLKANRLRTTVYRWSRAEGHVGEMSDGEDWVDQEEWGLDEPLRKGAAEGEEEVTDERRGKGRRRGAA